MMMLKNNILWWCVLIVVFLHVNVLGQSARQYDMDELANCGRTLNVDDNGLRLVGRGNTAPSNPPTTCIIYLRSTYALDDGSNKLQIEVESLNIQDCNVRVDLYNGRNSVGQTLQAMSCQYGSTGMIYSTGREITVKLSRPQILVHNEYQFTLLIKPYKDRNVMGTTTGVEVLSVEAIIGIVIGLVILICLIILFLWCCCTGRIGNFSVLGRPVNQAFGYNRGMDNKAMTSEKQKSGPIDFKDPVVWNTVTTGKYEPNEQRSRIYQKGMPRNQIQNGRDRDGAYGNARDSMNRRSGHAYEPYNFEEEEEERRRVAEERRRNEAEERRQKEAAEMKRREEEEAARQRQARKETLIDDVFDSDSQANTSDRSEETVDDSTLQKRSPKARRRGDKNIPEEGKLGQDPLQRYLSIDLQSHPDSDTISSPLHVNAGVRASVEDDDGGSPSGSLRKKKKGEKSPKAKRRGTGREPDPLAMPPEAFEPIFTSPIKGVDYKGNQPQFGAPAGYPGGFMPYGLIPAGVFAPGPPGTQTYAYAYQNAAPGGVPTQGAFVVHNMPTTEGNRRMAFAVEETVSPSKSRTPESKRRKSSDPFRNTPYKDALRPKRDWNKIADPSPDLSVVARGAAPPDPGQGQRSIAMKSGTDPHSGMQTTQVVWTDTVPDPTDPKPGENPQITRKTVTRVTARSGHGELPPESNPLLTLEEPEPSFLSPSGNRSQAAIMPATHTPGSENIAFYTGAPASSVHSVAPPERTSTPTSMHQHPSYNYAIRDRIPFDDSTV